MMASVRYLASLFFLILYLLPPEIEICLQYFLFKKFQSLCDMIEYAYKKIHLIPYYIFY